MEREFYVETGGTTYGPATVTSLLQWIDEGRIASDTVLIQGDTRTRLSAREVPELAARFAPPVPVAAAPPVASTPQMPPSLMPIGGTGSTAGAPLYGGAPAEPPRQTWDTSTPVLKASAGQTAPVPLLGLRSSTPDGNSSGTGKTAELPLELKGLNWGGFLLPFLWSISNKAGYSLLAFLFSLPVGIYFLFKGNELAWQNRRFQDVDQFKAVQRAWVIWGLVVNVLWIGIRILAALGDSGNRP